MEIFVSSIFTKPYGIQNSKEDDCYGFNEEDRNQETPQYVIDSLPRYTVRPNGAYSQPECSCGICYCKYRVGDKIICLPCQHNFHDYCIENWLKWVKSTCPVDKKSIIRHQYVEELNKERQSRILDLSAENKPQGRISHNDGGFLICEDEGIHLHDRKIMKKKRDDQNIQESGSSRDCSSRFMSPVALTDRAKSNSKQMESRVTRDTLPKNISPKKHNISSRERPDCLELNVKYLGTVSIFSSGSTKKLQESVDAIRQTVKTKDLRVKKHGSPQKFQEDLKTVTDLSKSSICSTKVPDKQNSSRYLGNSTALSPSKNKDLERHVSLRGIMGKKCLTFGDILEIENDVSSGWIYKRGKSHTFDRKNLKKL